MAVCSLSSFYAPPLIACRNRPVTGGPVHLPVQPNRLSGSRHCRFRSPPTAAAGSVPVPLISPCDQWGTWTALFSTAAIGLWSEKTKIGSTLSGAVVTILLGLAASSAGIIASDAPAYNVVMEYLLPMAIPLLLFNADLRRVFRTTGTLLLAFLLGAFATIVGTVVAYILVPMRSLGQDSWKIAAALMSSYIGGAVNYVAVSEALGMSASVLAAGVAVDNVLCAIYFTFIFALASKIPPEQDSLTTLDNVTDAEPKAGKVLLVSQSATAIAVSFAICKVATFIAQQFDLRGGNLPCITAIVVALATTFPVQFGSLAPAAEAIALVLMQVFFAVVGANGSISNIFSTAPDIFAFATIQLTVHVVVILGLGKLFGFERKLLLIASNANVGGPTTAGGMATAKGWSSLTVPGILVGIFGIAIATFLGIGLGLFVFRHM